ncbi:putative triacylglycerol lipase [Helianthus annuus]|nr:putative triacylglycerol lipase [Helianthus annuus]KAJ0757306.1 putative triacylglycerol lipase [Helianthus annuus]
MHTCEYSGIDKMGSNTSLFSKASNFKDQLVHGVSFASAAVRIIEITPGILWISSLSTNRLRTLNSLDHITNSLGATDVAQVPSRSHFFVRMGSNDYLNKYLMPYYPTRSQYLSNLCS